jgi:hypothetical protein
MITVIFTLREPGNHHEIARHSMPAVPRADESVTIEGVTRDVHEVDWIFDEDGLSARVLLRE